MSFLMIATLTGISAATAALSSGVPAQAPAMDSGETRLPRYEARFGRARPVVAVVGYNPSTELTDYVVPYGVLAASGVAEVLALSTHEGPITMRPSLRFAAQATLRQFDARHPQGADYVIVPNIYDGEDDLALRAWLRQQAAQGATLVGICDGVPTLAKAGLLEGRRATTHWNTIDRLERRHPGTRWIRNTRYIADGRIITTSGVSASIPIAMALVEAIAGREHALALGRSLGATDWSPRHNSEQFRLTPAGFLTALRNKAMFWRHDTLGIDVASDVDEIPLALLADAWGRTRRSIALAVSASPDPVPTRRGLAVLPDRVSGAPDAPGKPLPLSESLPPVQMLDRALEAIAASYGQPTAAFVALTMEYEWQR